jgi:hypothetical protein
MPTFSGYFPLPLGNVQQRSLSFANQPEAGEGTERGQQSKSFCKGKISAIPLGTERKVQVNIAACGCL